MPEQCLAFQYKQGVGLLNTLANVSILNSGHFKVAQKKIPAKSWLEKIMSKNFVYTGFNPAYAQYLSGEGRYIGVFDFDTDVQLDIHEVFKEGGKVSPSEELMDRKIMAGSMWNAQKRTRELREKKPWWQSNLIGFFALIIAFILMVYFFEHGSPINATVTVKVVNGTYAQAINNPGATGVVGSVSTAVQGIYNATVNTGKTIQGVTKKSNLSLIP